MWIQYGDLLHGLSTFKPNEVLFYRKKSDKIFYTSASNFARFSEVLDLSPQFSEIPFDIVQLKQLLDPPHTAKIIRDHFRACFYLAGIVSPRPAFIKLQKVEKSNRTEYRILGLTKAGKKALKTYLSKKLYDSSDLSVIVCR